MKNLLNLSRSMTIFRASPVYKTGRIPWEKGSDVLLSGHHGNVDKWRREQSLKRTLERRPDLLEQADLSKDDEKYLKKLKKTCMIRHSMVHNKL